MKIVTYRLEQTNRSLIDGLSSISLDYYRQKSKFDYDKNQSLITSITTAWFYRDWCALGAPI